ncbi:FkbM family methyltransferase [Helicobacter muridarum]|uniref:FkbM family methyltransferase n=1 Tax=Helicobacter muridarum TaxID=216 RepID=A0A099U1M4_9HELI|nr:FkbM family methyltransferase [Helicobacter muridarum]TLD98283.1 FkbM family methyltransferase [Helicobacter muridarum]STQ85568.1 methyltransferase, FkbM family [Helicobacter muridarum]
MLFTDIANIASQERASILHAKSFLQDFLDNSKKVLRYIFGYNQYTNSIISECYKALIHIDGIIDDFTTISHHESLDIKIPIINTKKLSQYITNLHKDTQAHANNANPSSLRCRVVVVTSQTKKAICKMQNLQSQFSALAIDFDFVDYFAFSRACQEVNKQVSKKEISKEANECIAENKANARLDLLELEFFDEFAQSLANIEHKHTDSNANSNNGNAKSNNLNICDLSAYYSQDCKASASKTNSKRVSNWSDFRIHFNTFSNIYEGIYNRLSDEQSRIEFANVLSFRLSSDWQFMRDFDFVPHRQYWEDFCRLDRVITFFDIGAYHGETSLEFIKRAKNYQEIYFFEPERENFILAQKALSNGALSDFDISKKSSKDNRIIKGFNIGLANQSLTLQVIADSTSSHLQILESKDIQSQIKKTNQIEINSLDNLLASGDIIISGGGQTMIKIDIESAEKLALCGMRGIIRDFAPLLAISAYHRFDDFLEIPHLVFSIQKKYKLYFRHYSSGLTESVFFFVPE